LWTPLSRRPKRRSYTPATPTSRRGYPLLLQNNPEWRIDPVNTHPLADIICAMRTHSALSERAATILAELGAARVDVTCVLPIPAPGKGGRILIEGACGKAQWSLRHVHGSAEWTVEVILPAVVVNTLPQTSSRVVDGANACASAEIAVEWLQGRLARPLTAADSVLAYPLAAPILAYWPVRRAEMARYPCSPASAAPHTWSVADFLLDVCPRHLSLSVKESDGGRTLEVRASQEGHVVVLRYLENLCGMAVDWLTQTAADRDVAPSPCLGASDSLPPQKSAAERAWEELLRVIEREPCLPAPPPHMIGVFQTVRDAQESGECLRALDAMVRFVSDAYFPEVREPIVHAAMHAARQFLQSTLHRNNKTQALYEVTDVMFCADNGSDGELVVRYCPHISRALQYQYARKVEEFLVKFTSVPYPNAARIPNGHV
jgi:hypothetical protein